MVILKIDVSYFAIEECYDDDDFISSKLGNNIAQQLAM
jgi:hypothetical protein